MAKQKLEQPDVMTHLPNGNRVPRVYIYARVSTDRQQNENQLHELIKRWPRATVVVEVTPGWRNKPKLVRLLSELQAGDTLIVAALDRLGRGAGLLILLLEELTQRKINLISVRESIDLLTVSGQFMAQVFAAFAQLERSLISERTKQALKHARSKGIYPGRKPNYSLEQIAKVKELRAAGAKYREIGQAMCLPQGTIFRMLHKDYSHRAHEFTGTWAAKRKPEVVKENLEEMEARQMSRDKLFSTENVEFDIDDPTWESLDRADARS